MPAHLRALGLTGAQISTALAVSPLLALVGAARVGLAGRPHAAARSRAAAHLLRRLRGVHAARLGARAGGAELRADPDRLRRLRDILRRDGRPGRRAGGRARARRGHLRPAAPLGLRGLRHRRGHRRRAAGPLPAAAARPAGALRDVGGAGGRLRRLAQPRRDRRADDPPARRRHSHAAGRAGAAPDPAGRRAALGLHVPLQRLLRRLPARSRARAALVGRRLRRSA